MDLTWGWGRTRGQSARKAPATTRPDPVSRSIPDFPPKFPGQAPGLVGRIREFSSRKFLPSQHRDKARKAALGPWGPAWRAGLGAGKGSLGSNAGGPLLQG